MGESQTFIVAGGGGSGIAKIIPWSQWRIRYECSKSILYESRVAVRHKEILFFPYFFGLVLWRNNAAKFGLC